VPFTSSPQKEVFGSLIEGKKYPFYAAQHHPEASIYAWNTKADKSYDNVLIAQTFANKFVDIARKNTNVFGCR
jgi:hypothetical protein